MNKQNLKNGMGVEFRNETIEYLIDDNIYIKCDDLMQLEGSKDWFLKEYNDDLTHKFNYGWDIVKVFTIEGQILWKRDKQQINDLIDFIKNEDIEVVKEFFKLYGIEFTKTKEPKTESMRVSKIGREDLEEKIRKIIDII